jgi:hypothetical protein
VGGKARALSKMYSTAVIIETESGRDRKVRRRGRDRGVSQRERDIHLDTVEVGNTIHTFTFDTILKIGPDSLL